MSSKSDKGFLVRAGLYNSTFRITVLESYNKGKYYRQSMKCPVKRPGDLFFFRLVINHFKMPPRVVFFLEPFERCLFGWPFVDSGIGR